MILLWNLSGLDGMKSASKVNPSYDTNYAMKKVIGS